MHVFKIFTNYTKEEEWLSEMAQKGYEVTNNCFGYTFKKVKPEKKVYRIDYRTFNNKSDFIDYCTMFEDSGWQHISGTKSSGKQYFKKISADSDNEIFSDDISKALRYKRASKFALTFASSYFVILVSLTLSGSINLNAFVNPKSLYLTPGIWQATGFNFWRMFLFETPFALGRGFIWLVLPIGICIFLYNSYKAAKEYKEIKKQSK